jgi:CRP-like cAMP-binding protein
MALGPACRGWHGEAVATDTFLADRLSNTWFGRGLPARARARLADIGRLRAIETGGTLLREGSEADEFGIVLSGLLALRVAIAGRGTATLLTVEPGDVFGWSALVPPYRSTSSVVGIEAGEALTFDGPRLRELLAGDETLAATLYPRLLEALGRRLTATRTQLLDLYARDREYEPW